MIMLTPKKEFDIAKSRDLIFLKCKNCLQPFKKPKHEIQKTLSGQKNVKCLYCSKACQHQSNNFKKTTSCTECSAKVVIQRHRIAPSGNIFCGKSCAAKYNNRNKSTGYRRSKIEVFFESKIKENYPDLIFISNDRKLIGFELDFLFPELRFALELNGIFHYEPIYKNKNFETIQSNDRQKLTLCRESGVELYVLDVSGCKHFSEKQGEIFWKIFNQTLEEILGRRKGTEPSSN